MLQHSRIRATYNIDGTIGGDCVQSYYCPCCTLMQGEREVVAREQRILRQQNGDADVTEQPGFQPQMRYSTSNLLEEIPEIFREHAGPYPSSDQGLISRQGSTKDSRRHSLEGRDGTDGMQGYEMEELQSFSLGHSDSDMSGIDEDHRRSRSRRSSNSSGKLRVRETSPLGSALNPITVSRSVSVDHGVLKPKQQNAVPQRSVSSPTRRRSLKDTNPPPANRHINYRLKSITTDDRPDFVIETIKEGSESSGQAPTITSRTAVKSLGIESLRSVASKMNTNPGRKGNESSSESQDDLKTNEAYTTFYNDEGQMIRRRISECVRPRASTPETPDIYQLHHANPNDDEKTIELKKSLAAQAKAEKQQRNGNTIPLKHKTSPSGRGLAQGLTDPTVTKANDLLPLTTPFIAEEPPAASVLLNDSNGHEASDRMPSSAYSASISSEHSGKSGILSLPSGVNDADDLASYLDHAVVASGLTPKNQRSIDRTAMPTLPIGQMIPRKQTLRLDFNSEDSESDSAPTLKESAYGFKEPSYKPADDSPTTTRVSPQTVPDAELGTGDGAAECYPSCIVTSDGPVSTPRDNEPGTPLDRDFEDRARMDDVLIEFGQLTPRHKKSFSDWFMDIGRSNSNKNEKDFNVKISQTEVPPVPVMPAQFNDHGYSLGSLRSFSSLGFRSIAGRGKSKGRSPVSTMRSAQIWMPTGKDSRTVSAPSLPAIPQIPQMFSTQPLADTTNNSIVAENIMETQDKLQVLQDECELMAEEVAYKINNHSPTPTPAATADDLKTEWLSTTSPSIIATAAISKQDRQATPTKLTQRSFPLIKSNNSTPKSSLSKATATTFLVSAGAVSVDHARHGADIGNANAYDKTALMSTIKEVSATPIYGTETPTTFAQSLEPLNLPTNLETPSVIPKGFLEHMPSESPMSLLSAPPVELGEAVIRHMSPVKYFPQIGTRTSSLKVETSEDTTLLKLDTSKRTTSDNSTHSGHVHRNQEVEVADQLDSTIASAALNITAAARVVSGTLDGVKDLDPFNHPFFSGTAVIDFGLMNPRHIREQLRMTRMSDEMGSDETIRPSPEVDPLNKGDAVTAATEENLLHASDSTDKIPGGDGVYESSPLLPPIAESSGEVNVVLKGDDVTLLDPPLDHPVAAERMDDALAAITAKPRAPSMHAALTRPVIESDELRRVCDQVNRGALSYDSDSDAEIITVGANGPVTVKPLRGRKEGGGVERSVTVIRRSMSAPKGRVSVRQGNARRRSSLTNETGAASSSIIGSQQDKLTAAVAEGMITEEVVVPVMPAASPKRVHSPAEAKLREMLGKVTGKDLGLGKERTVDMKGDSCAGEGGAEVGAKKKSMNSHQRKRKIKAEKNKRKKQMAAESK